MFNSLFDSDIEKLRKGKLPPDVAIKQAFRRLEDKSYPETLAIQEKHLLIEALKLLARDLFAPVLIEQPKIVIHIIYTSDDQMLERLHDAYQLFDQANTDKENEQLWPCINVLRSSLIGLALYRGTPQHLSEGWHGYWWHEITDQFLESYLKVDFCPKCGMDASLAELELSNRNPHYHAEDPRIWSIICNCGNVLQRFSADQGGQTNVREISG